MIHGLKTWLRASIAALAVAGTISPAAASSSYPAKPVTWVVPYAPGAATDALARLLAQEMSGGLGQSIVVENQPGAATVTASSQLKRSPADGYRVMSADITTLVFNPALRPNLAYDPLKDFTMVGLMARLPLVLVARKDLPAETVTQLLDEAKANPGKFTFASPGQGSPHYMAMELLLTEAGVQMLHVPYSGTGPSMVDLLAGRIDVMFASVGAIASHLQAGAVKALGISSVKPFPTLPNVQPLHEEDARLKGFEAYSWQGLVAPAGVPEAHVKALNDAIRASLAKPEVVAKMADLGLEPVSSTPQGMRDYTEQQSKVWTELVKEKKLTLE